MVHVLKIQNTSQWIIWVLLADTQVIHSGISTQAYQHQCGVKEQEQTEQDKISVTTQTQT